MFQLGKRLKLTFELNNAISNKKGENVIILPGLGSMSIILLLLFSVGSLNTGGITPYNSFKWDRFEENTWDNEQDSIEEEVAEWKKPENDCLDLSGLYQCVPKDGVHKNIKIEIEQIVSPSGHVFSISLESGAKEEDVASLIPSVVFGNFVADGQTVRNHAYHRDIHYIAKCNMSNLQILMTKGLKSLFLEYSHFSESFHSVTLQGIQLYKKSASIKNDIDTLLLNDERSPSDHILCLREERQQKKNHLKGIRKRSHSERKSQKR